jgi:hypothetical protein
MQFRPVGVEGPDEEVAPEALQAGNSAGLSLPAHRMGNTVRSDRRHDTGSLFIRAALAALDAIFGAGTQLLPTLLKDGFK